MTPANVELPGGYAELLADLKATVQAARWQAQRVVNTELLRLYWRLGHTVLQRQQAEGWGTRVIDPHSPTACWPHLGVGAVVARG